MENIKIDSEKIKNAVKSAIAAYGLLNSEIVPILNHVNRTLGYIPVEALEEISATLKIPKSQLFSTATFYDMLSTKPRGRHVIKFCESAPCHVVGGREIYNGLQKELNIKPYETSSDGKWTLITTSCLGLCSVGPVIMIDEDVYGNVTLDQISDILARYK